MFWIDRSQAHDSVALFRRPSMLACLPLLLWSAASPHIAARAPERIAVNDNRISAGTLRDGVLTVRLEARQGEWHPNADNGPGITVFAFGVEGAPLQTPGPVIRVIEGTKVHVRIRNGISAERLVIHGMHGHARGATTAADTFSVASGDAKEISFTATRPGTYYYWAATTTDPVLAQRSGRDSQLMGALIVEPRNEPRHADRVFLIGLWADRPVIGAAGLPAAILRITINGKAWPNTERLTYQTGDSVRMRVMNVGAAVHPMHLHGFYFNVDSRGNEHTDSIFGRASSPHLVNTERLAPGQTMSFTWVPTRPGNWLLHCHDPAHVVRDRPLDGAVDPVLAQGSAHHIENHALEMMGGPVMGISVLPRAGARDVAASKATRHLRLIARVDSGGTGEEPSFSYALDDGTQRARAAQPHLPGPTILLKRGEPVSITVVNELPEPTSVHWHGIELDSYYDGVSGFAGRPGRIAPAIAPRDSFEARFTPPRAGTFIYHPHVDEVRQQKAGLSGALIVVDSPASYDPTTDIVLLVTVPRLTADGSVVLLNGSSSPAPRELRAGTRYRLRFINVHNYRPSMIMKIVRDSTVLTWRAIAKDGMTLPPDQATVRASSVQMGNGETYDFEFLAPPPGLGELRLDINAAVGTLLVSMPLKVR